MYFFGGGDAQLNPEPPNNQNSQRWFPCCQPFVMLWFFTTIGNHYAYFLGYTLLRRKGIVFNDLWMSKFSAGKICNSGLVRVLNEFCKGLVWLGIVSIIRFQLEIWCKHMGIVGRWIRFVSSHWRCGRWAFEWKNDNIAMERSTIFNGKIHYFYGYFQ